ncbi:hypothetical protein OO013_15275 [Mangrovivirga sp. M17]|uniref:Cytochrome c domain-containing protein n=1 Tax=Mangrovivirga halotolerans TaxID=2993936 RepID=A0ABT3RTY3_9BACT|nr:hypothetical protein [Mangrovivirga halotolerans]MCX2745238.1 hypothetical protein [Mangrovivirga halotolerans]
MIKKNTFIITTLLLGLIILTNFFQINFNRGVISQLISSNDSLSLVVKDLSDKKGFNVHVNMQSLKTRQNLLNTSLEEEKWELSKYHYERLTELFKQYERANYIADGKNVSELTRELVDTPLKNISKSITSKDKQSALEGSVSLERSCNACHSLSGMDYLNELNN